MMDSSAGSGVSRVDAGSSRRWSAGWPAPALAVSTLMAAAFLLGLTGTARALTVEVGGTTYELSVLNGDYSGNSSTLEAQPWWGNSTLAKTFRDTAYDASSQPNKTIGGEKRNLYVYGAPIRQVAFYSIDGGEKDSGFDDAFGTYNFVTATEVTPVPEIDGAVLAQLALVLGTLWLVFGVGRRGDGETPAA